MSKMGITLSLLAGAALISLTINCIFNFYIIPNGTVTVGNQATDKPKTQTNTPSSEPTIAPTTPEPTAMPTEVSTPTPVIISATPEFDNEKKPEKTNLKKLEPNTKSTDDTETNETNKVSNNTTEEPNSSEEDSGAQNNSNAGEGTENESNVRCKLNINSSGRLLMETDNKASGSDAKINISSDSETGNVKTYLSYNCSDLLNQKNNYGTEPTSYITVTPGVYILNFINCDIENINFYLDTSIEEKEYEEENSETTHMSASSYKTIPSQDIVDIEVKPNDSTTYINVVATQSFSPLIKFYSKTGKDIEANLRILNSERNELQSFDLMQNEDSTETNFPFEEDKEYYFEINTSQSEEVAQETLCLQIMNNEQ